MLLLFTQHISAKSPEFNDPLFKHGILMFATSHIRRWRGRWWCYYKLPRLSNKGLEFNSRPDVFLNSSSWTISILDDRGDQNRYFKPNRWAVGEHSQLLKHSPLSLFGEEKPAVSFFRTINLFSMGLLYTKCYCDSTLWKCSYCGLYWILQPLNKLN